MAYSLSPWIMNLEGSTLGSGGMTVGIPPLPAESEWNGRSMRGTAESGNHIESFTAKILMVDDHPENLLALEAALEQVGKQFVASGGPTLEFIRATSGEDALRKVLEHEFAVILLDVQMPGMDGYETAEMIRKRPHSRHTPIIFLTAVSTSELNIAHGYSLGAVDYLTKPFDPTTLRAKVGVFIELYHKQVEIQRMADELQEQAQLLRNSNEELAKTNKILGGLYRELEGKSEELSKERDFVDKILETAGSYIIIFDALGRLERFNRASENVSGLKTEQARGQLAWELLVSGEDAVKVRDAFEQVRARKDVSFEMTILPNSKKPRRLLMSFTGLYDDMHQLINVIASGIDISERYEAEEKIRRLNEDLERNVVERTKELRETNEALWHAKETAEYANASKDQFLAVLSHELRTPLTPVLAIVQMLEEDPNVSQEIRTWIETIGRNVQIEARLIDDLLDLTGIANGKLELHLQPLDLHSTVRETIAIVKEDIRSKHLELHTDLHATNTLITADSARIQQVLWNLVKNAVKFTTNGGSITLRTFNTDTGAIRCQVIDTGIGIPREHLQRVFNAFDQGDRTITRRYGGLGLGLAISKALVDQHRGKIWAESEGLEKGSTFTIELETIPAVSTENLDPEKTEPHNHSGETAPLRILLVEDNDDTSKAIQALLERKGYSVLVAHSVQSAMEIAKTFESDILISDIGLPDGDGIELLQKLNTIRPTHGIAMSGFGMDEDVRRSLAAGFDAHLVKPVDFNNLLEVIAHWAQAEKI